jgi:hypothetical protein
MVTPAPAAVKKAAAAKATKAVAAKKAAAKPAKAATGNLGLEDARTAILKALVKAPATRTELKAKAPYGNYTALCNGLVEDGLIEALEKDTEVSSYQQYGLTAKGRKAAGK